MLNDDTVTTVITLSLMFIHAVFFGAFVQYKVQTVAHGGPMWTYY